MVEYLTTLQGLPDDCNLEDVLSGTLVHSTNSCVDGRVLAEGDRKFHFYADDVGPDPAIACLVPAREFVDPDLQSRFPLKLITPPHPDLLNSTFGERFKDKMGEVLVHPDDASCWKVVDGQPVILANHRGKCMRIARVTTDTQQGLLVAEGLFWPSDGDSGDGRGINDLTSQKLTDIGGGATLHEALVSLTPVV
ncbi:MAG: molybdopterin dinucleotide binding domain-containing protein [Desulforhopalus sp.]